MLTLDSDQSVRLVYLALLLFLLLGSINFGWNRSTARFRYLGVWALVAVALIVLYAYRAPVLRFTAPVLREVTPSRVVEVANEAGARELLISRADDGHFYVDAQANKASVRFLVDTGASGTVLTMADAERAGIDVAALGFNHPVQTANGTAYYASADLDSLTIGPTRFTAVPIGVMRQQAVNTSLLGMSTIARFASWRVEGDQMVLVP